MPVAPAAMAILPPESNTFIGLSESTASPSGPPPCTSTATEKINSTASSAMRAMPSTRAVTSTWKNMNAVIRMMVPNRKIQTGISQPNHSIRLALAKYAVTPVTAAENTR